MGKYVRFGGIKLQYRKGSPVYPTMQVQEGRWFITWQLAFWPQVPGQGSLHLLFIQALFDGQSVFRTHSGRQPSYGFPMYSGKQIHAPAPFCSRHWAFAPQGDGWQGVRISSTAVGGVVHEVNGSPMNPVIQIQFGVWLITWHSAFWPHIPGHGSLHFPAIQARWLEHSLLLTHSGLQLGGEPMNPSRQEHEGESPDCLHSEFGPQGDGWQGFTTRISFSVNNVLTTRLNRESTFIPIIVHLIKGSPVCSGGQLQIGLWFTTWHLAAIPQVPGHGSIHFWFTQAWFKGHSELVTHSGLQVGGLPIKPGIHEQTAWLLISRHWLFGPQGDGLQGCFIAGSKKI